MEIETLIKHYDINPGRLQGKHVLARVQLVIVSVGQWGQERQDNCTSARHGSTAFSVSAS